MQIRRQLHEALDEMIDEMRLDDIPPKQFGGYNLDLKIENGEIVFEIKNRTNRVVVKR